MEETRNLVNADSLEIAKEIISALDSKSARDMKLLHVEDNTIITDYFVICTGNSNTQIKSLSDEVEYRLSQAGVKALSVEGFADASWVVIDFGVVIVHIFNRETRTFYNLEKLWCDSNEIDISDLITEK